MKKVKPLLIFKGAPKAFGILPILENSDKGVKKYWNIYNPFPCFFILYPIYL